MRLTTVFIIAAIMQVSASGFAQRLTFKAKEASLQELFKAIKAQTGYNVVVSAEKLDAAKPITVNFKNEPLEKVLDASLEGQDLSYTIDKNTIAIKEAAPSFLDRIIDRFVNIDVRGRVVDEQRKPMSGATVRIKGKSGVTNTNKDGEFEIKNAEEDAVLVISYVGYTSLEISLKDAIMPLEIKLNQITGELEEVTVVYSDGFSKIPKERATGSFTHIDNETLNKQVSSDILTRLEGAVPGLRMPVSNSVSRRQAGGGMILRGEAAFFGSKAPLIVLDNFVYNDRIEYLNPNDIESITILRDAAAASIYGSQAGNGVIVITTKKGKANKKTQIDFSTNISITEKDRLAERPYMSVAEFVELERLNFSRGSTNGAENSINKQALSPIEELLIAKRDGVILPQDAEAQINALANRPNIYKDYLKYVYRNPVTQRHNLNISGGGGVYAYYISGGYDRSLQNKIYNDNSRKTLTIKNSFNPIKPLQISTNLSYFNTLENSSSVNENNYPYERLVDDNGLPASVIYGGTSRGGLREAFIDLTETYGLLDWRYRPLEEIEMGKIPSSETSILFNTGLSYALSSFLKIQLMYQIQSRNSFARSVTTTDMYAFRDFYNRYIQIDGAGNITNPIPYGGIVNLSTSSQKAQSARGQLNFDKIWDDVHSFSALIAAEVNEVTNFGYSDRKYGFTEQGLTYAAVDYVNSYPNYLTGNPSSIEYFVNENETIRRSLSYFGNASYNFKNRYTATASIRKDGANVFGLSTNQKWNPFWSGGLSWEINKERFFKQRWVSYLKLRATYGYTGTLASANSYLILRYNGPSEYYNLQQSSVASPPNPDLRWEKQENFNVGLDFGIKNRLNGSIEYFIKNGRDLLYNSPLDPTTGFWTGSNTYSVTRNYANMVSRGIDVQLNSKNLMGRLQWDTSFILGYSRSTVKEVFGTPTLSTYLTGNAVVKDEYFRTLYSYKWGGLSSIDGSPIAFLGSIPTNNYSQLVAQTTPENLVKHGSTIPIIHGSLSNSFTYKNFYIDFSILYNLGYYFRRTSYVYTSTMNGAILHQDYSKRWRQSGDEYHTVVPSIPSANNSARNSFYQSSEILASRGDHMRLQYINLGYSLGQLKPLSNVFKSCQIFVNANNLGLLWTYDKVDVDPESQLMPIPKTVSIGIRTTLK